MADVKNAAQILVDLESRSLVQSHDGRYSLTGDLSATLRRERVLTQWLERALTYFADWAERNHRQPKLIAAEAQPILLVLEWGVAAERWAEVRRLGHAAEESFALSGKWDCWAVALQCVLKAARARGDREVLLSAQVHALGFYRAEGFEAEGPVYEEAGIPHQAMRMRLR